MTKDKFRRRWVKLGKMTEYEELALIKVSTKIPGLVQSFLDAGWVRA